MKQNQIRIFSYSELMYFCVIKTIYKTNKTNKGFFNFFLLSLSQITKNISKTNKLSVL